ncbi:hypothetical protein [Arthrobacter sp. PAMC25284]|uniref:hypothetical protein n=1 Tax=Arthrobacter sp. PAMC25284 TaxID=2861279 RepID=UPI001C62D138|nr:hypothetical protein [Arthrobacter sp. PAMC25284]QYF91583.1 hypothetical protein KY499_01285 [Arthrobacter sp. PAMC25284]
MSGFQEVGSVPAEWWQVAGALGPLAVLVAAAIGAYMAWRTVQQKAVADNRAEWWKRTQWALDQALGPNANGRALGLATLAVLARSPLAAPDELELLDIAWKSVTPEAGGTTAGTQAPRQVLGAGGHQAAEERRVQAAAARLRVALDGRLGRATPPAIQALAGKRD